MNEARAGELLTKENTHPVAIDKVLNTLYPEWILQEPETTLTMVRSLSGQTAVNPIVRNKINALKLAHTSEAPWADWEAFQWVCQAFNDNFPDFSNVYRPELAELMIAIEGLNKVRKETFSDEVRRWLTAVCLDLGLVYVIPPLDFIQHMLNVVEYKCTKCGNVDLYEDNDKCDHCGATDAALIKNPKYVDYSLIKEAWANAQGEPVEQLRLQENLKGVHVAKLAAAQMLTSDRRQQLELELSYVSG